MVSESVPCGGHASEGVQDRVGKLGRKWFCFSSRWRLGTRKRKRKREGEGGFRRKRGGQLSGPNAV